MLYHESFFYLYFCSDNLYWLFYVIKERTNINKNEQQYKTWNYTNNKPRNFNKWDIFPFLSKNSETFLGVWCLNLNEKESPFYLEKVNYFSYSKQAKCLEYLSKCQMGKIRLEKYAEDKICTTQLLLINSHFHLQLKRTRPNV